MKLSKEEAIIKHREMWNWIAEQYENEATVPVDRLKQNFIKKYYPYDSPNSNCYCCAYAETVLEPQCSVSLPNCERCPLEWPSNQKQYMCVYKTLGLETDGLYGRIKYYTDPTIAAYKMTATIAREIANLPERDIEEE